MSSPAGSGIGPLPALSVHTTPPRPQNASAPLGAVSHSNPTPSNSARFPRNSSAFWKNDNVESGSPCCFSTVSAAQSAGIGNQASAELENPHGGSSPDQGIGTRHLSRPRSVCPDRSHVGSCSTSSGRSNTSGSPSSSPL